MQPQGMSAVDIQNLRRRLGWSQEQMAREVGVSFTTINRWERGRAVPRGLSIPALEQLARKAPAA